MTNAIYLFATLVMGVVFLLSGSSKLGMPVKPQSIHGSGAAKLLQLSETTQFGVAEIVFALTFMIFPTTQVALAWLFGVIAVVGIWGRKRVPLHRCSCFGASKTMPNAVMDGIGICVMSCSLAVVSISPAPPFPAYQPLTTIQVALLATVVTLLLLALLIRFARNSDNLASKPNVDTAAVAMPQLDMNMVLGTLNDNDVTLGSVIIKDKPLFIFGIHSACHSCAQFLPDIAMFRAGFGNEFPIILLRDSDFQVPDKIVESSHFLVDEENRFMRAMRIDATPFGLAVNGTTGRLLGPIAAGDASVCMLFAATLNARRG